MLDQIFTPQVIDVLRQQRQPSLALRRRLAVLQVPREPADGEGVGAVYDRARRAALDCYLAAGMAAGIVDDDLRSRLTGTDDNGFRSALSELMTYFFLTQELGLTVQGRPIDKGRPGRVLDFEILRHDENIGIEVKSPYADPPWNTTWSGDNAHLVEGAIDQANRQSAENTRNVLVVAPLVSPNVLDGKRPFMRALYGEEKVVISFDKATARPIEKPTWQFVRDGKLLKLWNGEPRFTRTSAVVVLRELERESTDADGTVNVAITRRARVLHNPHSPVEIPQDLWGDHPQFIRDGDAMRWSDGSPVND